MKKIGFVLATGIVLTIFFLSLMVQGGQAGKLQQPNLSAALTPTNEISAIQSDSNPAVKDWSRSLFFLVCGLGVVAGIVIMVLLAVRSAAKKIEPPSPPDSPG